MCAAAPQAGSGTSRTETTHTKHASVEASNATQEDTSAGEHSARQTVATTSADHPAAQPDGTVRHATESAESTDSPSESNSGLETIGSTKAKDSNQTSQGPVKKRVSRLGAMATRKKRKSNLAEMSAAVTAQPVKLNTLEKSKLDWEAHKGTISSDGRPTMSAEEREELEAQTSGGGSGLGDVKGYLHRRDFLDRVQDRLTAQEYEAHWTSRKP